MDAKMTGRAGNEMDDARGALVRYFEEGARLARESDYSGARGYAAQAGQLCSAIEYVRSCARQERDGEGGGEAAPSTAVHDEQ